VEPRKKKKNGYTARMDGAALVLSHDAKLPAVCMKCGSHEGITRREVVFSWTPLWVRYLFFCLVGVLLQLLMRVRASLVVPLCAPCNARWAAARSARMASIALVFGAALVAGPLLRQHPLGRFAGLAALAVVVVIHFVFVRPRVLPVQSIDESAIGLKAVNPEAAKEILEGARP
jgi:hypothetical protein